MKARQPKGSDHYAELGVARDAPPEEIKKAYRKRAREVHPDRTGGDHTQLGKQAQTL